MQFISLILICIFLFSGCGHTGNLYLPKLKTNTLDQTERPPEASASAALKPLTEGLS